MVPDRTVKLVVAALVGLGAGPLAAVPACASSRQSARHVRRAPHHPSAGIQQHNGGDRDADNNGGPSDGDGNF
jgi:hypothetical protein